MKEIAAGLLIGIPSSSFFLLLGSSADRYIDFGYCIMHKSLYEEEEEVVFKGAQPPSLKNTRSKMIVVAFCRGLMNT